MKPVFKLFFMLFALVFGTSLLLSCSEDWEDVYLSIDKTILSAGNSRETATISIQTNTDWKVVTRNASWVTFDQTSGSRDGELQMTIGRNSSNKRTGTVAVCAGTEYAKIKVEQAASTSGTLSVTTGSCTITRTKSGSSYKYTITATYTVFGGHLASEAEIMFGNSKSKTIGTITDGTYTATAFVTTTNSNYTVTYKAYAMNKSTGATVYETSKTKKYN